MVMRSRRCECGKRHSPIQRGLDCKLPARGFLLTLLMWLVEGFSQGLREQFAQVDIPPGLNHPKQAGGDWWQARVIKGMQLGVLPLVPMLRGGGWRGS